MTTSLHPSASAHTAAAAITCDPDFVLPDRSANPPRLPAWIVVTIAVASACAVALVSRHT